MQIYKDPVTHQWLQQLLTHYIAPDIRLSWQEPDIFVLSIPQAMSRLFIPLHEDLWTRQDLAYTEIDASSLPFQLPIHTILPMPGRDSPPAELFVHKEDRVTLHYDVIGLCFWCLSRFEEVNSSSLDEHGRFSAKDSHAYRNNYLVRPVVDEWMSVLRQLARIVWPNINLTPHKFQIMPSHDVDRISRYGFKSFFQLLHLMGGDLLKRGQWKNVLKAPFIWLQSYCKLSSLDEYNNFSDIMTWSEERGLKSAFYFIAGQTDPVKDAAYRLTDRAIKEVMQDIHKRGHEIGLHPSYHTYLSPDRLMQEADNLRHVCKELAVNQKSWGGRMHYLRWQTPATCHGWEKAGMDYDCSLGYADHPGFRCGTCHEYPAFDPVARKLFNFKIRPLIAMEASILSDKYMGQGVTSEAYKLFMKLKNNCRAVEGNFTLLWHGSNLIDPAGVELYRSVLED